MRRIVCFCLALFVSLAVAYFIAGCSNGNKNSTMASAVSVHISDPATCSAPQGQFSHVYMTITDVLIHQSANAAPNDSGWIDLTPNLKNAPMQVDMLGQATNQCFLANLGSIGLQPGTYQQIRVILADNTAATVEGNKCGSSANCVMLTSDATQTPQALLLSSESKTGIKIPPGQLAGGQFTIAAGQTKDLNIDFNACASIVTQGNGQFRLKPVLHAGEVALTSASINGTVIDGAAKLPLAGGTTVVALEQKDSNNIDRVIMETVAASNGTFVFCPVPAGSYDIVITAMNGNTAYAATVITGVQPGSALGNVPITAAAAPAAINGQVTSSTGAAGTVADITLSALQPITVNSVNMFITTPLPQLPAATATLVTAPGASCPAKTDCVNYALAVPGANPSVGAFVTTGTQTPAPPAAGTVNYTMDALAFVPGQASTADCTQPHLQTNQTTTATPLSAATGVAVTGATLNFTGCL